MIKSLVLAVGLVSATSALAEGAPQRVVVGNDQRAVDGPISGIELLANGDGTYDLNDYDAYVDWVSGELVEQTAIRVQGLTCAFGQPQVYCYVDLREVDQAFYDFSIAADGADSYYATERVTKYAEDRVTVLDEQTSLLGSDMSLIYWQ